jgi:prepilin-type N-terminal cleavage/methylation domain-containing protein
MTGQLRVRRRGRADRGFTLVEALICVVLVGMLASIALPRLNLDAYQVSGAVRGITSTLSYAQRLAITLQHNVVVAFNVPSNGIRIHEDADNDGAIDGGERVRFVPLSEGIVFGRSTAPAHTIGGANINFTRTQDGMPAIYLRRDGSASENGGFYIVPVRSVARNSPLEARACEIVRATGRVTWSRYTGGAWVRGD